MIDREAWLLARRQGISASDVAGIMGLSEYSSPFKVYADKVGLVPDQEASEQMIFGKDIEQIVAGKWAKRAGVMVHWLDELVVGPEPWILATPDAEVIPTREGVGANEGVGVEIKTMGYKTLDWGEPGTDQIPERHLCQVQWQMLAKGWKAVHVVAFYTGPRKFDSYLVRADAELQKELRDRCYQFWTENVLAQVAPEIDWTDTADAYLKQKFPTVKEEPREATDEEADLANAYAKINRVFKQAEKNKKALSNRLKESIGNAKSIVGPGFKVAWYDVAGSTYQVTRKPGRTLKPSGPIFKGSEDE